MAVETVVKTIGTTGDFSTLALWEAGAPASLTTAERSACGTFLVANFTQGESLSFVGSGATGKMLDTDNSTYMTYGVTAGNPAASDVITGGSSGGTCVLTSGTPDFTGVIWQGQCQNEEFSGTGTMISFGGSTNSASAYKHLTTVAGASFRDNANVQTNALRYNASNGCGITSSVSGITVQIAENNVHLSNLQMQGTHATNAQTFQILGTGFGTNSVVDFCIIEGSLTSTSDGAGLCYVDANGSTLRNCLIVQRASAADHICLAGSATSMVYVNCSIVCPDDLAEAVDFVISDKSGGSTTFTNCGFFAGATGSAVEVGLGTVTYTTCYTDTDSPPTGVTQTTYADEFENVSDSTRDFRLKSGAAEIDTGTTDATNAQFDIAGTERPEGSAYDVGCWEFVAAAASDPTTQVANTFLMM